MDGFVAKPVTLALLSDVIRQSANSSTPACMHRNEASPGTDQIRRAELVTAFGNDGLRELDNTFFADMADILQELHFALAADDLPRADRALHSIKGAAANLGFIELATYAEHARHAARETNVEAGISERFDALRQMGERAQAA